MPRSPTSQHGYSLIFMLYLVLFINIAVATAMPKWSQMMQREREEETIFRALQYAEAIRLFEARFGRLPTRLEELIELEPRSIRQLYPNPMTEDGSWGLLVQTAQGAPGAPGQRPQPGQGQPQQGQDLTQPAAPNRPQPQTPNSGQPGVLGLTAGPGKQGGRRQVVAIPPAPADSSGRRREQRTTGPIAGVWPGIEGEALRVFMDQTEYAKWHFTTDLIQLPVIKGPNQPLPRSNSDLIGRPFRPGLVNPGVQSGNTPEDARGRELTRPSRRESRSIFDRQRSDDGDRR